MTKNIVLAIVFLIVTVLIIQREWIKYGWQQARGQMKIVLNAQPLEVFLTNEDFPDSLKKKLILIKKVKSFAEQNLKFKESDNYHKLYWQEQKELMWVVTAAYPYRMENYCWTYPFLGKLSYKGFFIEKEAEKEAKRLKSLGFDVRIRNAAAWSTLGWLDDPVLSGFLDNDEDHLIELILHELTHAEVFIPDSTDFNENFASFVGQEATKLFLSQNYSVDRLNAYQKSLANREALNNFFYSKIAEFSYVYSNFGGLSKAEKEQRKYQLFDSLKHNLRKFYASDTHYIEKWTENNQLNNAHLLAFKRYSGQQEALKIEFQNKFDQDLIEMINFYKINL